MKIYLIDFENVKSKGLTGIDSLTEYDRVIIFYSENADTINFEMHQKVLISKAEVEYFKVHVGGKNALDFQLSTLLGYLVSKNYYSHIFVISNDKSFDFLHDFWHGKYIAAPDCIVYRTKTIAQAINYAGGKKQVVIDEEDTDDNVFASQENKTEEAEEIQQNESADIPETPAEEVKSTDTAVTMAEEKPQEPAAEEKSEITEKNVSKETNVKSDERSTEKRASKPEPQKDRPQSKDNKTAKGSKTSDDKIDEFTISTEELNALEASFSAYSIITPTAAAKVEEKLANTEEKPQKAEMAAAEPIVVKVAEKNEAIIVTEKTAEQKPVAETAVPADKNKQKPVKEFYPALKEALKKANCKPEEVNHISQLLINSDTKEEFHNALAKDYKQDATELYKLLRPKYLRLKEMYAAEHPEYVSPDTVTVQPVEETKSIQKIAEVLPAKDESADNKAAVTEDSPADTENNVEKAAENSAEQKNADIQTPEAKPAKTKKSGRPKKESNSKKTGKKDNTVEKPAKNKNTSDKQASEVIAAASGDRLAELLDGKCTSEEIELIRQLFREVPSRQQLYIRMIKQFGKKSGCIYYNVIKSEYETLSAVIK